MPPKKSPRLNRHSPALLRALGGFALLGGILVLSLSPCAAADPAGLLVFPSTADLKSFKRLRQDAVSTLHAKPGSDTLYLLLEKKDSRPWAATFSRRGEFQEEWILEQLGRFVPETSPHPLADPAPGSLEEKLVPGLKQQWSLRGRRGAAWMGSGLRSDKHFLIFRAEAPMPVDEGKGPLRLRREAAIQLDTLDGWLLAPCPDPAAWAAIRCFRPSDASPFLVRVAPYKQMQIEIRHLAGDPLNEVRAAAESIAEFQRIDYARDLSVLLHGEALRLLAQAARKVPVFSWPDWKFLEWKQGKVTPETYLQAWSKGRQLPDPLLGLEYRGDGLHLRVEIHFNGQSRVVAQELP